MKTLSNPYLYIFYFLLLTSTYAQQEWKLAKDRNDVKVYLRDHKGTGNKEFKAITVFENASLEIFYDLFKDANKADRWSYAVSYSKILDSPSPTEDIVYYQIDTPWPLQSRDVIQRQSIIWNRNSQEIICDSYSLPNYLPGKQDFIRVEQSSVKWTFQQLPNGDVEVEYQFYSNPKIPIPDNIAKYFIVNGPIFVFEHLRKQYDTQLQSFVKNTDRNR